MAEKEPVIVIKKVYEQAGGGHGGSWKVALADFMTALMAFFLCMWLINQTEEVKKEVSDYFSTPSIIEYNFSNYGVQLTLEKLFLDLINEPLKVLSDFITPVDYTPNFLSMGTKNIVMQHLAEQLGEIASNVEVNSDEIVIEIPDRVLFKQGTANTTAQFIPVMEQVRGVTAGLEDANIYIDSIIDPATVAGTSAEKVAEHRLDLISGKVETAKEHGTVDVFGRSVVDPRKARGEKPEGTIRIRMKQKDLTSEGKQPRKLGEVFGSADKDMDAYNNFVKQITERKKSK